MQDQIPEPVIKKVEFGLLLYLACPNAPQNVIQVSSQNYCYSIVYMHFAVAMMTSTCTGYCSVKKINTCFCYCCCSSFARLQGKQSWLVLKERKVQPNIFVTV